MQIKLSESLSFLGSDSHILGYIGETNSRTVTFKGLTCEGADYFKLRLEYADGVSYEVDITSGSYTVDGSVLRIPGKVKCQIMACKSDGETYTLVKKSNVFELVVKQSLEGEPAPIPSYEQSVEALDKVLNAETNVKSYAEEAKASKESAEQFAENAKASEVSASGSAGQASESAKSAGESAKSASENATQVSTDRAEVEKLAEQVSADKASAEASANSAKAAQEAAEAAAEIAAHLPFAEEVEW